MNNLDEQLQSSQEFEDLKNKRKGQNQSIKSSKCFKVIFFSLTIIILVFVTTFFILTRSNGVKIGDTNPNSSKKILVIGSIGYDMVTFMNKFPIEGETITGRKFEENPGGKGNNQAISAARAGAQVSMLGAIGDDHYGQIDKKLLEDNNVKTYLKVVENESTQIATIMVEPNGANRIIIVQGANLKIDKKQIDDNLNLIKESDIIIFQLEIPMETVEYAINICYDLGKTIILNPAPGYKLSDNILKKVTYLTPNESELGLITGMPFTTIEEIKQAGKALIKKGVKNLIVTIGEKGAYYINSNEDIVFETYKVKAIDTTGAGDCFTGVFATYLAKGKDFRTAIKYANIASSISVTRVGTTPSFPYEKEIEEKFHKYEK